MKLDLKYATIELMNISSMLQQTEKDDPNIQKCLEAFNEMKNDLENQLKNKVLFKNRQLTDKWTELLGELISISNSFNLALPRTS